MPLPDQPHLRYEALYAEGKARRSAVKAGRGRVE